MKQTLKTLLIVAAALFIYVAVYNRNRLPENLPTIQEMQRVVATQPMGAAMTIIDFDPKKISLRVWIDEPLTEGTDGACEEFARIIWELMKLEPRLIIYVDGEWVPSRENPIDYKWAKRLISS